MSPQPDAHGLILLIISKRETTVVLSVATLHCTFSVDLRMSYDGC